MYAGKLQQQSLALAFRNAERALAGIQGLLRQRQIDMTTVDAFAFAAGPGAFTGLRVACALAQGLAFGCDRPVIAVNSLRALAHAAGASPGQRVLAAIDARMGQVYWAVFESGAPMRMLAPAALADPDQLAPLVRQWRPEVIAGNALQAYESAWTGGTAPAQAGGPALLPQARADAAAVAELACVDWGQGRMLPAREALPEYVRDRVALTLAQRRSAAAEAGR